MVEYYSDDAVDLSATEGGTSWEGYGAGKADNGDDAILGVALVKPSKKSFSEIPQKCY